MAEKVCKCNGCEVLLDDDGKLNVVATFGPGLLLLDPKNRIVVLGMSPLSALFVSAWC